MRPSKENAVKALTAIDRVRAFALTMSNIVSESQESKFLAIDLQFIGDFLASAAKRLPREESLEKDAKRVRPSKAKRADA